MQYTLAVLAGFAAVALAAPQGVTAIITPTAAAPAGCTGDASLFQISVTTLSKKGKRANPLEASLSGGILTDNNGKRGYIASNYQLQFDSPVQNGAIYTGGFSLCANDTLALGGSAIFYECLSGSFYNIYNENWAPQCQPIFLDTIPLSGSISATTAPLTQTSDGQVGASTAVSTHVTAVTSSAAVVTSISDHQIQGATATTPVTSSVAVVSTTIIPVTSSAAGVSQITDHQVQAPTVTSAVTSSVAVVQTITPSVKTSTASVAIVSQISDHQIQAPTATSAVVTAYTGAAAMPTVAAQLFLAAAGAAAFIL